jgi:glycosyltransferase involved in cell wall biosynthesis
MNKRKQVCFIAEGMVDFRLIDGLSQRVDLTLVSRRNDKEPITSQPTNGKLKVVIGPASRLKFGLFLLSFVRRNMQSFDSYVVLGYGLAALCSNLALFDRPRMLVVYAVCPSERYYACRRINPIISKRYSAAGYLAWLLLARLNCSMSKRFIAVSNYLAELIRSHGASSAEIRVIPAYGVNSLIFKPAELSRESIRAKLKLPVAGKLIFYSSRVVPEKDFRTVLRSLRRLLDRGIDVWLMNTSGGYREFLDEARALGVDNRVIAQQARHPFLGLPEFYQAADVCIQASLEEGLGISPLEALACGIPVIASSVGGLNETIVDGVTGWTVPPNDDSKLAEALMEVLNSGSESRRRAFLGRDLVLSKFDEEKALDEFADFA